MKKAIVITTINEVTKAIAKFLEITPDFHLIIIGDKKSKPFKNQDRLTFYGVDEQINLDFKIVDKLPFNHYCRKNLGYLIAMKNGFDLIYDTDDDNIPYPNWGFPDFEGQFDTIKASHPVNIYRLFSDDLIWPRGLPLDAIHKMDLEHADRLSQIGVWQGLADDDPDVDAIFRLLYPGKQTKFKKHPPVVLDKGVYCPFNSQNTLWKRAYLMYAYLPATVTFRFTDILRGYIAQRCLWAHDSHLGFTEATVYQMRNEHDFMKDFESEIPCYLDVSKVIRILDQQILSDDPGQNLLGIYQALSAEEVVKPQELGLVEAWVEDVNGTKQ